VIRKALMIFSIVWIHDEERKEGTITAYMDTGMDMLGIMNECVEQQISLVPSCEGCGVL
jgi:hypothetical protein